MESGVFLREEEYAQWWSYIWILEESWPTDRASVWAGGQRARGAKESAKEQAKAGKTCIVSEYI
jgi:hypothetical protein